MSSTPFPSVFFPLLPFFPSRLYPPRSLSLLPHQGFVFILSRNAGGARPIYMTKISLIPLTSKCPPQTVFISGIEIRYANCLRHQCHLLLAELRLCGCAARLCSGPLLFSSSRIEDCALLIVSFFCLNPIKQFASLFLIERKSCFKFNASTLETCD